MGTIKSYTDLSQSKKLAEILSLESADMLYYCNKSNNSLISQCPFVRYFKETDTFSYLHCWSLAALLNILPDGTNVTKDKSDTENEKYMCVAETKDDIISTFGNNPIDACVATIEKLHEQNLL